MTSYRRLVVWTSLSAGALLYWIYSESRLSPSSKALAPSNFVPLRIVSSLKSGRDHQLFTLELSPEQLPDAIPQDAIWSLCVKDDDLQVERPYTPLYGLSADAQIVLWVKKYKSGEVSRWLHSKKVGDQVWTRGPLLTWPWKEGEWDEIIMVIIAGDPHFEMKFTAF